MSDIFGKLFIFLMSGSNLIKEYLHRILRLVYLRDELVQFSWSIKETEKYVSKNRVLKYAVSVTLSVL